MSKPQKVVTPPEKKIGAQTPVDPNRNVRSVPPAAKEFAAAQYKVLAPSFINGQLVAPGDIVQLPPGTRASKNLELIGKKAGAPVPVEKFADTEETSPVLSEEELSSGKRTPSADAEKQAGAGHKSAEVDPI